MELSVGDRLKNETGEWGVVGDFFQGRLATSGLPSSGRESSTGPGELVGGAPHRHAFVYSPADRVTLGRFIAL